MVMSSRSQLYCAVQKTHHTVLDPLPWIDAVRDPDPVLPDRDHVCDLVDQEILLDPVDKATVLSMSTMSHQTYPFLLLSDCGWFAVVMKSSKCAHQARVLLLTLTAFSTMLAVRRPPSVVKM